VEALPTGAQLPNRTLAAQWVRGGARRPNAGGGGEEV
jgi:hypothetical protein